MCRDATDAVASTVALDAHRALAVLAVDSPQNTGTFNYVIATFAVSNNPVKIL